MSFVAWLDRPGDATPARVGGKAASLGRLHAAGFPVPPGFAVTVDAYRAFHHLNGVEAALAALEALDGPRPSPAQVREVCAPILQVLRDARLPGEVAESVGSAFSELAARAGSEATFAVRSSSASEDGAAASFAGLYESFLNLRGEDEVLGSVQRCYHCLWEPRAVQYRAIKRISHRSEAMGVVVMQTIHSAVSGVAFSLNPVSGATDEVVINASWGLGEAIVSGAVTPDNFVVGKDGAIRQVDVAHKHVHVVPVPGGTEEQAVPPHLASSRALSDDQVRQVAETTAAVERHYGRPMDIEFAYDAAGRFFLLQARPITTR
jgi:phosphoenolpyruvate synthase/pyruvate phosphate dikinase